jgi:hypothetical protein
MSPVEPAVGQLARYLVKLEGGQRPVRVAPDVKVAIELNCMSV